MDSTATNEPISPESYPTTIPRKSTFSDIGSPNTTDYDTENDFTGNINTLHQGSIRKPINSTTNSPVGSETEV